MKAIHIIYWATTGIVSAAMVMSGVMYLSHNPQIENGFPALGYPVYLIPFLGTLKLLGAIALLLPRFKMLNEWAYAGFAFCFLGATWTHLSTHTPFMAPLLFLIVLFISYGIKAKRSVVMIRTANAL